MSRRDHEVPVWVDVLLVLLFCALLIGAGLLVVEVIQNGPIAPTVNTVTPQP